MLEVLEDSMWVVRWCLHRKRRLLVLETSPCSFAESLLGDTATATGGALCRNRKTEPSIDRMVLMIQWKRVVRGTGVMEHGRAFPQGRNVEAEVQPIAGTGLLSRYLQSTLEHT